jgi:DeoR/GlpR family transcriptional regulator of sugar metabolism
MKKTKKEDKVILKFTTKRIGRIIGHKKARSYFDIQEAKQKKDKKAIAMFIVDKYFHEGDSILLDAGTSLYPLADQIVKASGIFPDETHFTIMTHNYRAFEILVKAPKEANLNIVLAGGRYDQDLKALFGAQTVSNYDTFFPRTVVIGISGLVSDMGLFCHGNTEEQQVKELIFKKSCARRIIVAHHTKLGRQDSFLFGKSIDLIAGTDECILVTTIPDQSDDSRVKDRYHNEVNNLRKKYGIDVQEINVTKLRL